MATWDETYNLGRASGFTLTEMANVSVETARQNGINVPDPIVSASETAPVNSTIDASQLSTLIGWYPRVGLEEAVSAIVTHELRTSGKEHDL